MTSVELDPFESGLVSDPSTQHEAAHQMVNLGGSHLPRSGEQETIEELRKEPRLSCSKTDRARSQRAVPR